MEAAEKITARKTRHSNTCNIRLKAQNKQRLREFTGLLNAVRRKYDDASADPEGKCRNLQHRP